MELSNVVNKGNSLEADLTVDEEELSTKISPEFVINGSIVFQMKLIRANDHEDSFVFNNFIFVRFTKKRQEDVLTYSITFTSVELGVMDKRFTNNDGTWHGLQCENKKEQSCFDVSVRVEVLPSVSSFASLHEDTGLTDFELRGTDGAVRVHRAVLAAASPVMRQMLSGAWRETTEGCVNVPETTSATLQHLKNYLYTHTLPESGFEQLLLLSSYYMMHDLEQKCVDNLVQNMSAANACDMIEFAAKHKMRRLLFAILRCVQSSIFSVTDMSN